MSNFRSHFLGLFGFYPFCLGHLGSGTDWPVSSLTQDDQDDILENVKKWGVMQYFWVPCLHKASRAGRQQDKQTESKRARDQEGKGARGCMHARSCATTCPRGWSKCRPARGRGWSIRHKDHDILRRCCVSKQKKRALCAHEEFYPTQPTKGCVG